MVYICTRCGSYVHPWWCPQCHTEEYIRLDIAPDPSGSQADHAEDLQWDAEQLEEDLYIY